MADITLDQFRAISKGSYNAGQIDFTTNDNGEDFPQGHKKTSAAA